MKKKYIHLYLVGLLLLSVACTGNFRDYNTDLSGITDDDLIIDDNGYGIRIGIPVDTEPQCGYVQWLYA